MNLRSFFMAVIAVLAMASPTFSQSPDIRICTGGMSGKYFSTALALGVQLKGQVNVIPIETSGSLDNFYKLADGTCDAAIVQSDAYGIFTNTNPTARINVERVVPLYSEYVHLVCNKNAGINTVRDLLKTPNVVVLVGPNGSGTSVTWETWGKQNKDYVKVRTEPIGGTRAVSKIIDGVDAQCMLFVSGLKSGTMNEVNELGKDTLQLVSIDDGSFDDVKDPQGKLVYHFEDVPAGTYSNLQTSGWFGSGNKVPTLAIGAILVANTNWIDSHSREYDFFTKAAIRWANQNNQ